MSLTYEAVRDFLYREARYLDDKQWDEWLELYAPDAEFWMPAWDDKDELVENPQTEISLIWYGNRSGLEDRVFRIRTERSSATIPDTRTSHNISNLELLEQADGFLSQGFRAIKMKVGRDHLREDVETVVLAQAQIKEAQIEDLTLQQSIGLGRAIGGGYRIAFVFEAITKRTQDGGFIVHQQNAALMLSGRFHFSYAP